MGHSNLLYVTKDQFMLKMSKVALAGAIAAAAMVSTGANAATVNADATVNILAAVELEQTAVLDFGVVGGSVAGTVTIDPVAGDTAGCSPGLMCAGTSRPGAFTVEAANNYNVSISVAPSTSLTGPGAPMALNSLTPSATTVLGAGATLVPFYVGGVLSINASQVAGTYTGQYNVTADYQ